jgi:serine-type D-Ala-D-Ala carboxypeptidase
VQSYNEPLLSVSKADAVQARIRSILEEAIQKQAFPGASLVVTLNGKIAANITSGRHIYDPDSSPVTPDTIFDVASLTKVLATTPLAMWLYERGRLQLDDAVVSVLPEFHAAQVTFRMLLAHSSGLPRHIKFYETCSSRSEVLDSAFATPLEAEPGTRVEYSDVGFILLGVALERLAGESLETFSRREIFQMLAMRTTAFTPSSDLLPRIPPAIHDTDFRHRLVHGEVQDENAFVMGGVAPHAGLFATAADVAKFADCMLQDGSPLFKATTVNLFTRRQATPSGTSRALGWDTPSTPSQSGQHFSTSSFGHLGFTGCSLWIDPEKSLSITLLTNRLWPDGKSQTIRQFRPAIHDAIIEGLLR